MFFSEPHSSLLQPKAEAPVWRYMDALKYLSLLSSSELHFARIDTMRDPWEGAYTQATVRAMSEQREDASGMLNSMRFMLKGYYISCWHVNQFESAAMWDLYQREGRGVAVESTWGELTSSLSGHQTVFGGLVSYRDYATAQIDPSNVFNSIMSKRASFEHEMEARLVVNDFPSEGTHMNDPSIPLGTSVGVDLVHLVKRVWVSPESPAWVRETIRDVTHQYGFNFEVIQSDLYAGPR